MGAESGWVGHYYIPHSATMSCPEHASFHGRAAKPKYPEGSQLLGTRPVPETSSPRLFLGGKKAPVALMRTPLQI